MNAGDACMWQMKLRPATTTRSRDNERCFELVWGVHSMRVRRVDAGTTLNTKLNSVQVIITNALTRDKREATASVEENVHY